MEEKFGEIVEHFETRDRNNLLKGQAPMGYTETGFWGVASMHDAFEFFKEIGLGKYPRFCDLGSGDGRVVLVASLFTNASGIEYDKDLIMRARRSVKKLGLNANFERGNFLDMDFDGYDALFIYPDKEFSEELLGKLKKYEGDLFVYHNIYLPEGLEKGKTHWVNGSPIIHYKS